MLSLNFLNIDLDAAKKAHLEFFEASITNKIIGRTRNRFFYDFIEDGDNLEKLIIGSPEELIDLNNIFVKIVDKEFGYSSYQTYTSLKGKERSSCTSVVASFFDEVRLLFNYDLLSEDKHYNSYDLTSNLGIRTCVYCNRNFALTKRKRDGGRLMSPQLDHWFPESKFPLLQISFCNLIPCCEICNTRIKNDTLYNLTDHFHPYQQTEGNISFGYRLIFGDKIKVFFSNDSDTKIKNTYEGMYIDEMYEAHRYEIDDLIKMKKKYSSTYLKNLKSSFPEANLSDKEIYRFAFGVEMDKKDFHKRPFSKFKSDILKQLKMID